MNSNAYHSNRIVEEPKIQIEEFKSKKEESSCVINSAYGFKNSANDNWATWWNGSNKSIIFDAYSLLVRRIINKNCGNIECFASWERSSSFCLENGLCNVPICWGGENYSCCTLCWVTVFNMISESKREVCRRRYSTGTGLLSDRFSQTEEPKFWTFKRY